MDNSPKIVVLGTDSGPTYAVFNFLKYRFAGSRLYLEQPEGKFLSLKRRARKLGYSHVAGQALFHVFATPILKRTGANRIAEIQKHYGLSTCPSHATNVNSVNSDSCMEALLDHAPDLIVLAGTRILSKRFLQTITCPILNIHAGITPLYRGVHGGYWALAE